MKALVVGLILLTFSMCAVAQTAICRDGTASYSAHRSGTCSHHGGVAQWGPFLQTAPSATIPAYRQYTSQKCQDLAETQNAAELAAKALFDCLAAGGDDCDQEMQDAQSAHDDYETAYDDADGDCQ